MLFTYRNLYGLMDKTLAECIRTRDCGSNLHGGVKKIGTMTTSSRSIYLQNSYNGKNSYEFRSPWPQATLFFSL